MGRSLSVLVPAMEPKVTDMYARLQARGYEFRPYFTDRDTFEQGRLWRQSRTSEEIAAEIAKLKSMNCLFLAHCIESVGPQHGQWATNAIPGLSWHNWCEAVDQMLVVGGKAIWDMKHPGYAALAEEAHAGGLTCLRPKDSDHVQLRSVEPDHVYTMPEIDRAMELKFGATT